MLRKRWWLPHENDSHIAKTVAGKYPPRMFDWNEMIGLLGRDLDAAFAGLKQEMET